MMIVNELVRIFSTTNFTEAEILRNVVTSEGIPCALENENQAGLTGILEIKGLVQASDEVRARLALSKYQKQVTGHKRIAD